MHPQHQTQDRDVSSYVALCSRLLATQGGLPALQVVEVRRQLAAAAEATDLAAAGAKDQSAKADRDRRAAEERSAESAAALARERADRKADAASFAAERKDLQVPS